MRGHRMGLWQDGTEADSVPGVVTAPLPPAASRILVEDLR